MKIVKFFGSSVIATGVDFILYSILIQVVNPTAANAFSASVGMIVNFSLQYTVVFNPTHPLVKSFLMSALFSVLGVMLSTLLIYLLTQFTLFHQLPIVAKVITTGIIFFYNYFTRKFALGDRPDNPEVKC